MAIATKCRWTVTAPAVVAAMVVAATLAGCGSSGSPAAGPGASEMTQLKAPAASGADALLKAACGGALATTVNLATVTSSEVTEASGIVASPDHAGVWWTHNDSGDTARFFAVDEDGSVPATFTVAGATATDWEDIAIGPGFDAAHPDRPSLYLADIGDNARNRAEIVIHRVVEPDPRQPGNGVVDDTPLRLRYPDGPHDAETLIVDHDTGELVIVTKDWSMAGRSEVYRTANPDSAGAAGQAVTLDHVATVDLPPATLVTGGDLSPDGTVVALRSYDGVRLYPRPTGEPLWKAFSSTPCPVTIEGEKQGEAVGFAPDGRSLVTISEGKKPVLHRTGL